MITIDKEINLNINLKISKLNRKEKFMKKNFIIDQIRLSAFVVLALSVFSFQTAFAQCTTSNNVDVTVKPEAPLVFQFFPVSLLGIGKSDANLSAFQTFGIQFNNTTGIDQNIKLDIGLTDGTTSLFSKNLLMTLKVSPGPHFIGTSQLLNADISGGVQKVGSATKPSIDKNYLDKLKGGLPSGTFIFEIKVSAATENPVDCGRLIVQVMAGATVDLIMPSAGSSVSSLPQFQWSAVGGQKFKMVLAKLKPGQTQEDALNNSSQRVVLDISSTSYQATAGGPTIGGGVTNVENNLTWNPGLADGDYCYRVTMIQEDPITGTQNLVNSNIANFTVSGSGGTINTSGLNTDEIIGLLSGAAKGVNIADLLKGYSAFSIEINGKPATIDELRTKLNDISASAKWSIKP